MGKNKNGKDTWLCICDCGNVKVVTGNDLKSGNTQSCGCFKKEMAGKQNLKHGHAKKKNKSRTYISWENMNKRCNNKNDPSYIYYGGRGIIVCDRWLKFENFLEDMGECPPDLTLDRIDNDNGYYRENCRWTTTFEQHRNMRSNNNYIFKNQVWCLKDLAIKYNIKYTTLYTRIHRQGLSIDKALTIPIKKNKNK